MKRKKRNNMHIHKPKSFLDAISIGKFKRGMTSLCIHSEIKAAGRLYHRSRKINGNISPMTFNSKNDNGFPLWTNSDRYDNMWCINDPLNLGMPEMDYENYDVNPNLMQISTVITKEAYNYK